MAAGRLAIVLCLHWRLASAFWRLPYQEIIALKARRFSGRGYSAIPLAVLNCPVEHDLCYRILGAQLVKTFQYRIYPTRKQQRALEHTLDECRWLYNHFLEQRTRAWEERQESVGLYDQHAQLPALKRERISLQTVHSQVLQNVGVSIDRGVCGVLSSLP
jgi:Helix-turn-helix domain